MRESEEREAVGEGARAHQKGYIHRLDRVATSFFFTNFPEDVDKQGRRFGFVKFRDVGDVIELLRSLSNIWIRSFKLRINLSKFSRRNDPEQKEESQKWVFRSVGGGGVRGLGAKSFKEVVVVDDAVGVGEGTSSGAISVDGNKDSEVV
ncbi:hypothetical protein A2U01_0031461 [Trifolium medium]|uniref:Endonuclease/exonuclease/phosphatase family protein n=1 Tax=Trifolium medium TaxID=97028 RepID=A0A392PE41_9FABA|nr:hypothetical protein [Trifolium medium]